MVSPVDLTFLARQERKSDNCKSSETIKVFKMQFIVLRGQLCNFSKKFCTVRDKSNKEFFSQAV